MEYLCVVCAIECVMPTILKPKLLKLELIVVIAKAIPFGTRCPLMPFFDSLALVLVVILLEKSLSGFHFSILLQFIIIN